MQISLLKYNSKISKIHTLRLLITFVDFGTKLLVHPACTLGRHLELVVPTFLPFIQGFSSEVVKPFLCLPKKHFLVFL